MYVLFSIAIIILLAAALIFRFRRKRIICRILGLSVPEKVYRLNCLLAPFGFEYQISQDIFVTRLDAWQRDYGYRSLYDRASPLLGMVFDCEPVYFDYQGKTWLLEFWKGQYGINTGAEIGIYRADTLLSPAQRPYTLFHTVPDEELPVFELELVKGASRRYRLLRRHWWLAGFCMGEFTSPELLSLRLAVTFHSGDMLEAFYQGLLEAGWCTEDICVCGRRIDPAFTLCITSVLMFLSLLFCKNLFVRKKIFQELCNGPAKNPDTKKYRGHKICLLPITQLFSHPDCTVGSGISPDQPVLKITPGRGLYRRLGLSPDPEEFLFSTVFIICHSIY